MLKKYLNASDSSDWPFDQIQGMFENGKYTQLYVATLLYVIHLYFYVRNAHRFIKMKKIFYTW